MVGEPKVDSAYARGGWIAQVTDLKRRRLSREDLQATAAGVAREIDQNVDPIGVD